jgi:RNA polymerase sigma-70 factor (ECF subfamily)
MYEAVDDATILDLIPACQRGDAGAVEALYDLYANRIYRYLLGRTGNTDAAEDLTTEVFLRVIEHVHRFRLNAARPASSVSAWLYRIAANLAADHHRSQRRRAAAGLEESDSLVSRDPDPQRQVERRESLERLSAAMEKLTEDQRLVVVGKFGEGMSNAQTAAWLGKTEGAIEALQHRALRTLGRLLGAGQDHHE